MRTSITTVTDGQKKQVRRFAEDAMDRAIAEGRLDKYGLQKLIENGDELQDCIIAAVKELLPDNWNAKEVRSSYAYPKAYKGPKPIRQQVEMVAEMFGLDPNPTLEWIEMNPNFKLPTGAEFLFAIPRWEKIAPTYGEAVQKVLAMIAASRSFHDDYLNGQTSPEYLRQHAKTVKMFQKLAETQKGDILIVPAQFGFRHRGRSPSLAREVFKRNEFGLGVFAIGIMLLIHPEREVQWKQLHIDCAGDEFSLHVTDAFANNFSWVPVFRFHDISPDGELGLNYLWSNDSSGSDLCGSASAFLP